MPNAPMVLDMQDADVLFYKAFFSEDDSANYFQTLQNIISWEQQEIKIYGKQIKIPRLTAWYGDADQNYSYSGISHEPLPWTDELLEIKSAIETVTDVQFNSVLLNLYRDGSDSVGWHSDDEPELGQDPVIASVSFGEVRKFKFKHKDDNALQQSIDLTSGGLLLMQGATQHHWKHSIPKTRRQIDERINLTFRVIRNV
jgi:alkylated DNA repair dioxygenase AlkB